MQRYLITVLITILIQTASLNAAENNDIIKHGKSAEHNIPYGVIDPALIPYTYSGGESFRYDISYSGGFKLGELHLSILASENHPDGYEIHARVTTENGMFSNIYPVEDSYVTKVSGPQRLPYHYEVWQKEGYSYEAHRVTQYDQKNHLVYYWKNENPVKIFKISNTTQNEFSSFFASRIMPFVIGEPFVVPTYADEKRIEVVVMVRERELLNKTLFGKVETIVIEPIMTFSGLYDKRGDTVIWYTDNECRVPVLINSKILLGSLTAKLVAYDNPACDKYDGAILDKYRTE